MPALGLCILQASANSCKPVPFAMIEPTPRVVSTFSPISTSSKSLTDSSSSVKLSYASLIFLPHAEAESRTFSSLQLSTIDALMSSHKSDQSFEMFAMSSFNASSNSAFSGFDKDFQASSDILAASGSLDSATKPDALIAASIAF